MFKRILNMQLPAGQSAFLWGARQAGKSSYLKSHFKQSLYIDLLDTHELVRLTRSPSLLREEILALDQAPSTPIIIDEIQKIPDLLNEVHYLIENYKLAFILCGSSARKLKTQSTNLLGGRAWIYHLYPLTFKEIPEFNLLKALQHGLIPRHYLAETADINNHLQAYIDIYLTDEIRNEGLVRNLAAFARFLDVAGFTNGEMINASNIARDCGVDRTTVQGYYQILVDTLLGYFIYPFHVKKKRDIVISTPKFYLFDVGVANYLANQSFSLLKGNIAGKSFEHFILMELIAYRDYLRKRFEIQYWRTKTGHEVDFILGNADIAIEVKISDQVHKEDLKGLIAFCEEFPNTSAIVVSQDKRSRKLEIAHNQFILILPWNEFLTQLWQGDII